MYSTYLQLCEDKWSGESTRIAKLCRTVWNRTFLLVIQNNKMKRSVKTIIIHTWDGMLRGIFLVLFFLFSLEITVAMDQMVYMLSLVCQICFSRKRVPTEKIAFHIFIFSISNTFIF